MSWTISTRAAPMETPAPAGLSELADVRVLAEFDESAGQNAESIALEPGDGAVIGMISARQVVRVSGDAGPGPDRVICGDRRS